MTLYRLFEIAGGETGLPVHFPYSICQKIKWYLLTHYYRDNRKILEKTNKTIKGHKKSFKYAYSQPVNEQNEHGKLFYCIHNKCFSKDVKKSRTIIVGRDKLNIFREKNNESIFE